jgi:hypothetical protein
MVSCRNDLSNKLPDITIWLQDGAGWRPWESGHEQNAGIFLALV